MVENTEDAKTGRREEKKRIVKPYVTKVEDEEPVDHAFDREEKQFEQELSKVEEIRDKYCLDNRRRMRCTRRTMYTLDFPHWRRLQ